MKIGKIVKSLAKHPLFIRYRDYFDEFIYRFPNSATKRENFCSLAKSDIKLVKTLKKEGIICIPDFLSKERLESLQIRFESEIKNIENNPNKDAVKKLTPLTHYHCQDYYEEKSHDPKDKSTHNLNPLNVSELFIEAILDNRIISIVSEYFGKKITLQQAAISRIYPKQSENYGSYQWHRDTHGRRVNIMMLLSDVSETEQRMSYLKRSQKKYLTVEECRDYSRISDEAVDALQLERFECSGKAGTIFIFDANGAHRGNRNLTKIRDVLLFSYGAGRYEWEFEVASSIRNNLSISPSQQKFLDNNIRIKLV